VPGLLPPGAARLRCPGKRNGACRWLWPVRESSDARVRAVRMNRGRGRQVQLAAARQERDDAVADAQPRATGAGSRARPGRTRPGRRTRPSRPARITPRLSSSVRAPTVTRRPGSPPDGNPRARHAVAGTLGKAEQRRGLHGGSPHPVDPAAGVTLGDQSRRTAGPDSRAGSASTAVPGPGTGHLTLRRGDAAGIARRRWRRCAQSLCAPLGTPHAGPCPAPPPPAPPPGPAAPRRAPCQRR